jgi:hypothetical protein
MQRGTRVELTDGGYTWTGTVTGFKANGLVIVKWDNGNTEYIAPQELTITENSHIPSESS